MAQYRQSGMERMAVRNGGSDHISIGVRAVPPHKHSRFHRRFKGRRISAGILILMIALFFLISASTFLYLSRDKGSNDYNAADDDGLGNDQDFLTNITRTERSRVLEFGHGSVAHGGDSRYWERDDRRRDEDYSEDVGDQSQGGSISNVHILSMRNNSENKISAEKRKTLDQKVAGLYDEAGRNELKMYEAEYEASLKSAGQSRVQTNSMTQQLDDANEKSEDDEVDADDEYDYEIDMLNTEGEDYNVGKNSGHHSGEGKFHDLFGNRSFDLHGAGTKDSEADKELKEDSYNLSDKISLKSVTSDKINADSRHVTVSDGQSLRRSSPSRRATLKKKPKRRKFSGACEMKFLDSTTQLVEPPENRKFVRFSLQYTEGEEKPIGLESWEPRFAGHQNLQQREKSYIAQDQRINCGFVKGPKGSQRAGFDLAEDDAKYISTCHIAVISCIFGNSDRLRSPMGKTVSRLSRKNVCFVMFVDEVSLKTLSSEGQMPDRTGFVGLWKVVMVKNLPYTDMRRVGKIPKLLPHRLFPSARYSIWLDSKLRLQLDPLLVLEYFLWRKGYEYAISNHYDRHCVWDEVAQNKKLNKYNHTIIDQQFAFYQADGLKRFNRTDPNKLLPSNVPEGSFIVRAHTPMSNLFSCLWYNEVERFTPRDQLSFAYTYHKLKRMNPDKPFYLNMFKDCERRKIAKLYRHRSEERRYEHVTE